MKIISWNINGIRSNIVCDGKMSGKIDELYDCNLKELIDRHSPDIICFQETKCGKDTGDKICCDEYPYKYYNESKGEGRRGKGYSGTAIWSKIKPISVSEICNDFNNLEGRFQIVEYDNFHLINMYVPNSGTNFDYRINTWDKSIKSIIDSFVDKPLIVTGDFNVVHKEEDIWNPKTYQKGGSPGVLKEEISMFSTYLENYVDCYREIHPNENKYTWWDMRSKGREKGRGWRIDYFLIQSKFKNMIKDCDIDNQIYGSDHCPIVLEI